MQQYAERALWHACRMRLRAPGAIGPAIQTLQELAHGCRNSTSTTSGVHDARDRYLRWVDDAFAQLKSLFREGTLAEGLHSALYWRIFQIHEGWTRPWDLLLREVNTQCGRLEQTISELTALKEFVEHDGRILVIDTSALVEGGFFEELDWVGEFQSPGSRVRIVIPIIVIEELDDLKDRERKEAVGERARKVLRRMLDLSRDCSPGTPVNIPKRKNVTFEIFLDDDWHRRMPNNDSEIIDQALLVKELTGQDVGLVTGDASMEFRARRQGLRTFTMRTPQEVRGRG